MFKCINYSLYLFVISKFVLKLSVNQDFIQQGTAALFLETRGAGQVNEERYFKGFKDWTRQIHQCAKEIKSTFRRKHMEKNTLAYVLENYSLSTFLSSLPLYWPSRAIHLMDFEGIISGRLPKNQSSKLFFYSTDDVT